MSSPDPRHDSENTRKQDPNDLFKYKSKKKALHKMKEAPLHKLKRLIGESEQGRKDWKSMLGK